jgi:hypothetical protein
MMLKQPAFIANFDSAAAMVRATGHLLRGKDFPMLGLARILKPVPGAVNKLPRAAREQVFALGGFGEAVWPRRLKHADAESVSRWVASQYPDGPFPAVMVGSSSGALIHLCAALGVPWLPQTFLVAMRQTRVHPDEPKQGIEEDSEPGRWLLERNPELQLHHQHDANQDRLMIKYMSYLRVKRRQLGEAYRRFLRERLQPGGTIVVVECQRQWPVVKLGERQYFQHGALGGATEKDFIEGSDLVEDYLARYRSHRRRWDSPEPEMEAPEAEWGFEPSLREDVEAFAEQHGFKVVRLTFYEPEHLSPLVADLYRWWYGKRRMPANRLLVESFIVMEPYWTLRTGSVPFWMKFNMQPSLDWLHQYLDDSPPYDDINLMLFAHGVEGIRSPTIDKWKAALGRARRRGQFIGVEEDKYPRDFAVFGRYHRDIQTKIPARYPMPGPLSIHQLKEFLDQTDRDYRVQWHGLESTSRPAGTLH